ncbi:MAG: tRNA (cytidine(34)-2'-O)-methyltransferase [Cyanobacteriota bacterium]|jgi:tRNA (cytidine/uridine-2'-O-)-methyltransferase|nr:tRNA (cytidine(34)-2'-O)-methyltransferase [Cyanobacteriota bacterium]
MPQVVLYQPQIPPNTGNIARTCAATGTELHLVEPLGFEINDRRLRRAGLDYWPWVALRRHPDWQAFQIQRLETGGRLLALSRHAHESYLSCRFRADDWLLFGRETDGLPAEVVKAADACLSIPMACTSQDGGGGVRSLNLSVSVAVVLFEALRQLAITPH